MDLFAPWHLIVIGVAILLLFGGNKIPEMMGGIGKGMKEFKKSMKDEDDNENKKSDDAPKAIPSASNKKEPLKE